MAVLDVPRELAHELVDAGLATETFRTRGAAEVAIAVWSVGSAVLSVAVAPEALDQSVKVVRSWLGRQEPQASLRAKGPGGEFSTESLTTPDELRAAFAAVEAVLFPESSEG